MRHNLASLASILHPSKTHDGALPTILVSALSKAMSSNSPASASAVTPVPSTGGLKKQKQQQTPTQESAASATLLPSFLRLSKTEIQQQFVDLEWAQRYRLAQGSQTTDPASKWARASGDEVLRRNRYLNIEPFLSNRVRLRVPEGFNDYINASSIVLQCTRRSDPSRYIATQGPKEGSMGHMWRMIWHETAEVAVIVMLTQFHEAGKDKCFQYFPFDSEHAILNTNEHDEFQDGFCATVELLETKFDQEAHTTVRKLRLRMGTESKTVWHLLFAGWPDFTVPEGADRLALLNLIKLSAEKNEKSKDPRIIHCSAGVGRSGTFIALDYLLTELTDGAFDDRSVSRDRVAETVDDLRQQRMMMVQGASQFQFLYDILREQWAERCLRLQHSETGTG